MPARRFAVASSLPPYGERTLLRAAPLDRPALVAPSDMLLAAAPCHRSSQCQPIWMIGKFCYRATITRMVLPVAGRQQCGAAATFRTLFFCRQRAKPSASLNSVWLCLASSSRPGYRRHLYRCGPVRSRPRRSRRRQIADHQARPRDRSAGAMEGVLRLRPARAERSPWSGCPRRWRPTPSSRAMRADLPDARGI